KQTAELEQVQQQQSQQLIQLQQLSQQLTTSLDKERDLNRLKSAFVSLVSHEFRTPLATIESSIDLIQSYLRTLKGAKEMPFQRHIAAIKGEINRFSQLMDGVLIRSQLDAGKVGFDPQPVDLVAICKELIELHFSHQSDGRTIDLSVKGQPVRVALDAYLVTHMLVNLLSNALKFSQRNAQLSLRFEVADIILEVIDEGIGIPLSALDSVFDPFYRASNATLIEGTGLGLSITQQFVKLHGGQVQVSSQEHQGTMVTITLPLVSEY
ncbi:MAG: HAMP domain-containing histidine kinase, partial [Cytophagaceae bacterium]